MTEEKMTNCPRCQKPILNGGVFAAPARFNIRCPWCQATLQVNIQTRITTEVVKIGGMDPAKEFGKPENPNPSGDYFDGGDKPIKLTGYLYPEGSGNI